VDVVRQFLGIVETVTLASVIDDGCGSAGAYGEDVGLSQAAGEHGPLNMVRT
jgi:hypothetical protein